MIPPSEIISLMLKAIKINTIPGAMDTAELPMMRSFRLGDIPAMPEAMMPPASSKIPRMGSISSERMGDKRRQHKQHEHRHQKHAEYKGCPFQFLEFLRCLPVEHKLHAFRIAVLLPQCGVVAVDL